MKLPEWKRRDEHSPGIPDTGVGAGVLVQAQLSQQFNVVFIVQCYLHVSQERT